ncbi:MAG: succinylglutamate desuccinylase/aspartoacylase family protein [Halofilum sp. (in: g-proteobacteria)]|nr:succinylglutamate desuccinylase/aspartoacylase family protein [Halofilum sp. (in: g-proteobacteria)]
MSTNEGETPGFLQLGPRVTSSIDWSMMGKQHGYLSAPYSANESAWGAVRVPITVIRNGEGPSIMFTGGNHGDEFEGPIALKKLAAEIQAEDIQGTVIMIPCLNPPAVMQNLRCSPLDGVNMNRAFPGRRTGTVTEMLCHYVSTVLLPKVEAVIDIHSGGRTLNFVPFAAMHYLKNKEQFERTRAVVEAFDAPISLVIEELDTEGMIDGVVEETGKVFMFTELAGGGSASPETVGIAEQGVRNVMHHYGILQGKPSRREDRGLPPARIMATPDTYAYTVADESGLFECLLDLGDEVEEGQLVARIHSIEKTGLRPGLYYAHRAGTLIGRHFPGLARPGDCLAVIGVEQERLE